MAEYKPNSHKYRNEQKKKELKKVTTGTVKVRKKSTASKLLEEVLPGDKNSIKDYVFMDVIIPSIKKALSDVIIDSVNMMFYGDVKRGKSSSSRGEYVSYRDYSSRDNYRRRRTPRDIDDVIFESQAEAEDVLNEMDEVLETYEFVSVADYYEIAGVSGSGTHTNNRYGWSSLQTADIIRVRDGWTIKMPRPKVID